MCQNPVWKQSRLASQNWLTSARFSFKLEWNQLVTGSNSKVGSIWDNVHIFFNHRRQEEEVFIVKLTINNKDYKYFRVYTQSWVINCWSSSTKNWPTLKISVRNPFYYYYYFQTCEDWLILQRERSKKVYNWTFLPRRQKQSISATGWSFCNFLYKWRQIRTVIKQWL